MVAPLSPWVLYTYEPLYEMLYNVNYNSFSLLSCLNAFTPADPTNSKCNSSEYLFGLQYHCSQ